MRNSHFFTAFSFYAKSFAGVAVPDRLDDTPVDLPPTT